MPRRESKVTALTVDFSGVEDRRAGGTAAHVQEGDYLLKLQEASVIQNKSGDGQHVLWIWGITKGPEASARPIYHRTSLKPENLWALRNILTDLLGKDIPKKSLNIDFAKYQGRSIGATLEDGEPYDGKVRSQIAQTFPADEYEDKGAGEADEDEEEDEVQDADVTSDDDEDLEEIDTEDI